MGRDWREAEISRYSPHPQLSRQQKHLWMRDVEIGLSHPIHQMTVGIIIIELLEEEFS